MSSNNAVSRLSRRFENGFTYSVFSSQSLQALGLSSITNIFCVGLYTAPKQNAHIVRGRSETHLFMTLKSLSNVLRCTLIALLPTILEIYSEPLTPFNISDKAPASLSVISTISKI